MSLLVTTKTNSIFVISLLMSPYSLADEDGGLPK